MSPQENTIIELTPGEVFELLSYLQESDYPKGDIIRNIIDILLYEIEDDEIPLPSRENIVELD